MSLLPSLFRTKSRYLNPFTPFTSFEDAFSLLSDEMNGTWANMRVDVEDTPAEYIVRADVPGFQKNEINVELANQMLSIRAEREEKEEEKKTDYVVRERRYRSLERSIPLAFAGSPDNVKAELRDGVLEVHVKKTPEKQAKRIPVA